MPSREFSLEAQHQGALPPEAGSLTTYPTSISGTSSCNGTDIREWKGSQTSSNGSGGGLGSSQRSRCLRMRLMTNGCSMKEITFIFPPHSGHFNTSTSQIFFRSTAHSCRMRREHDERTSSEVSVSSSAGFVGKIPWRCPLFVGTPWWTLLELLSLRELELLN